MKTRLDVAARAWHRPRARSFCLLLGLLLALVVLVTTFAQLRWMGLAAALAILFYSVLVWHFMCHQAYIERQLQCAKQAAGQANTARVEFLSTVSHEIRTPMNAIIGMAELMRATPLDAQQQGFAKSINDAAQALMVIVDDILDFSKIDTGTLVLESHALDLLAIVEASVDVWTRRAQEKGLRLASYVDPALPAILHGDPGRVRQILLNLLSNAVKFTASGTITVSARLIEQFAGQCVIRFEVKDTGVGIDAPMQARLFMPFTQADGSVTRKFGGAGLGLSICQRLVDLMGGSIGIGSRQKVGSVFWFELRLPVERATPHAPPLAGELLLIAPDDGVTRSLSETATGFGLTVRHAASMTAGMDLIKQLAPQAVVVIDTAVNDFSLADDMWLAASMLLVAHEDARVDLPLQPGLPILLQPLKQADWHRALSDALRQHDEDLVAMPAALDALNAANVANAPVADDRQILLVEDNLMNQKVAVHQLHQLGYAVDLAVNGEEALAALNAKSYAAILMDCQMPLMDGFEATRRIRRNEQTSGRHIPIIAITANTMQGDRARCLEVGMDDYLSKPILRERLGAVLSRHISTKTTGLPALQDRPSSPMPSQQILDMNRLSELFDDDQASMCAMLDLFIKHTGPMLEQLQQATTQHDFTFACGILHRLIGACSNLGAAEMTALAQAADTAAKKNDGQRLWLLYRELGDAFVRLCEQVKITKEAK